MTSVARSGGLPASSRLALAGILLSLTACMVACGGDAPTVMPAVEGKRLDVAQSDLEKIGLPEDEVEVIGGGAFGVVDASNWDVCDQEPGPGEPVDGAVRLTVDRACETEDGLAADETESAPSAEPSEPETSGPPAEPETFKMPKLVGQNLQDAQDRLQSRGSYVLRQDDATGLERFQVLDANWKVCSQKPRAGKRVPVDRLVVLGAVKLNETCP